MIRDTYQSLLHDDTRMEQLVADVHKNGYAELPDFFDDQTWGSIKDEANQRAVGNKKNPELVGTKIYEMGNSDELFTLCERIHKTRCATEGTLHQPLLRNKQSVSVGYKDARNDGKTKETEYHYDAAYVNIVIPLILPNSREGHLYLYPNLRKNFPRFINAPLSSILRRIPFARTIYPPHEVVYQVGALYLFFGDVSLHGVPPITTGERMIIALNSHW